MPELSTVEYNHEINKYVAILTDGEIVILEATSLRDAELEAARFLEASEFTSFFARQDWQ